ncbi:SMC family ATPase [Frigoribacterium sp. CFBP9039]|uniref:SMC family ATPase n=1 Tax=Frigoribacterium sp. CFBP9029 TaxID=3096541 RepID=UPI002A6AC92D|nr:SMC family ATPase [Frigoribacterium sp. CFBP9039]MDY0946998.1 SMC family ATPase [Frigoribacterium sp. CFBP9039]
MILHRLTLRAIGPYAGEHSIDFAALGASGVFLLEGPTGSGKSTIIDALVFALYGGLAGSTSSPDRLRSHHAAPTVEPFVEVVFETAAGIHRVRRTPAYRRPKARGTGTTPQNQTVTLVLLTSPDAVEGTVVSTSAQETGAEIARILGLTRQQFVQTVVLPQGEFAAFLRSTGEKRKEVLQSLFGTEIYEKTTAQLVERRVAARASIAAAEREVELALGRLREATGVDDEVFAAAAADFGKPGGQQGSDGPEGRDGLGGLVAGLAATAVELEGRRAAAVGDRDAARSHLDAQRRLQRALERRAALLRREAAAREVEADVQEARGRVDDARRASSVTVAVEGLRRADERLSTAVEQVGAARESGDLDADLTETTDRDSAAARRDALTAEAGSSAESARLEATLVDRRAALDVLEAQVAAEVARVDELERAQAELPAVRRELEAALGALIEAVVAVGPAEAAVAEGRRRRDLIDGLDRFEDELDRATADLHEAARVALDAAGVENDLRRRKIAGMAGELAGDLLVGEPCPVCGSEHHPAPAVTTADHPDDDAVDRATDERVRCESALAAAAARRSVAVARRDERATELGGVTRAEVEAELDAALARVEAARRVAGDRDAAALALDAHDAETERRRTELEEARVDTATAVAQTVADRRRLDDDTAAVGRHLGGRADSVAELVAVIGRRHGAVARLVEALDAQAIAVDEVARRRTDLDASLADAGFADVEAVAAAVLDRAEVGRLDAVIAAHDRELAVVAAGLGEPEIAGLDDASGEGLGDDARVGVEAAVEQRVALATERAAETEAAATSIAAETARARDRAERSSAALVALRQAAAVGDDAAERARAIVRMADLASASSAVNVKGVTLGTYVLLRRFDDVVAAANVRLSVMSSGRYQLESSDEREATSRSRKTGLSLAIRDHATDTTRDPGSFSGGETFYASLSLALGLADVVQAEAGGLQLGTLFVDEGFGSLDPTTLDAVMTELGRLSAAGRVVGIVSHVDELKQRIADRIEVRRLPDGSSTLRSTVGG